MKRISAIAAALTILSFHATAWACMGGDDMLFFIGLLIAPFMAIPYALFGTAVIASQARSWFQRPWRGWFVSTVGAWLSAMIGAVAGFGAVQVLGEVGLGAAQNLEGAVILSTPLVFEIAYLMWLHTRATRKAVEQ